MCGNRGLSNEPVSSYIQMHFMTWHHKTWHNILRHNYNFLRAGARVHTGNFKRFKMHSVPLCLSLWLPSINRYISHNVSFEWSFLWNLVLCLHIRYYERTKSAAYKRSCRSIEYIESYLYTSLWFMSFRPENKVLSHISSLCHCGCKGKVLAHGVHSNLNASYVSNLK